MATPTLPTKMRAWTHDSSGLPSQVLHLSAKFPIPSLGPSDLLIKITHAALNPGQPLIMNLSPMFLRSKPSIPEMDFAGTVLSSSPSLNPKLEIGTRVFGNIPIGLHFKHGRGAIAEYVVVPSDRVVVVPEGMKDEEAAGLGMVGCSALALLDRAQELRKGDRVLVNGASGGIGTLLVQMLKEAVGEEGVVVGICSGTNREVVLGLGCDEVVDYQKHDPVWKYLAENFGDDKFDWIFDTHGIQDLWVHCESYLKTGKPFITIGNTVPSYGWSSILFMVGQTICNSWKPRFLGGVDRPYAQTNGIAGLKNMEQLARMYEEGKLKIITDSVWSFDDVLQAYEKLMSKHARGKITIRVDNEAP